MICPRCGSQIPDEAPFCQECGLSQSQSTPPIQRSGRICQGCGQSVPWYKMKCKNCGQYYGAAPALIIILSIVIIAIGLVLYMPRFSNEKEEEYPIQVVSYEISKQSTDEIIIIEYEWKNTTDSTASFSWEYIDKVFQDGIECQDTFLLNEDASASTEIQPGKTYRFKKAYKLHNKTSDVQVTAYKIFHKGENILEYTIHMGD